MPRKSPQDPEDELAALRLANQELTSVLATQAKALEDAEEMFRTTFDQDAIGMAIRAVDPKNPMWLDVNDRFCEMLGYSREELLKLSSFDVTSDSEKKEAAEKNKRLMNGEIKSFSREKRYLHKDGHAIWVNIWLSVVHDKAGKPQKIISAIEDISKRKAAEEAMRTTEKDYRSIFENATQGMYRSDLDGHALRVNPAMVKLNGYESEAELLAAVKVTSQDWYVEPGRREEFTRIMETQGRVSNFESEIYRHKTREKIWISENAHLIRDDSGEAMFYEGTATDITIRKNLENELHQSRDLFSLAFHANPNLVALVEPSTGEHLDVNEAWLNTLKFQREDVIGKSSLKFGTWPNINDRDQLLAIHQSEGRVRNFIGQLRAKDGTLIDCSFSTDNIKMDHMEPILWTVIDITESKKAEKALNEALADAERANQAKSEFLATMSHEFRTPLNAILGFSEIMGKQIFGPLGSAKYTEYSDDIFRSGEHMLTLVNDVLDIAAIEAGKRAFDKEMIDLRDLIPECLKQVELATTNGGIELATNIATNLPSLNADRRSIAQILINLLSNATRFTGRGGSITISAYASGNRLCLSIQDTGTGIPEDKLASITEPFVQAESDPHKARHGTGLGLSIVKSLVDAHDGQLEIKSIVGEGTTVSITFPCI
ncbi:MAG: PAS domain S-box protein [Alphaproteobacteria bacterium]|jgi:PAS domain S-box-containing protein|nr:PAS domain S-box protein [Alphaproteobacteria bacterium]MBT4018205.1 PAS domain S-box protein [Alphaproteobacteria bacterium]MBT4965068.1 PAS domain S-box protein [Alphaproteobacteria bacterium]MBT5160748.1 PAS domain S-box protein [Alphaproteobacteria bacterium]MBT5918438.1 PAS domain S-box protein [Alphaproteobacteria bacterium]